uniref:Uncharacterized protein n=1 Tax=Steinernema glaseri TaxID=37863 RepID=A0A1I8ATX8_9BILA
MHEEEKRIPWSSLLWRFPSHSRVLISQNSDLLLGESDYSSADSERSDSTRGRAPFTTSDLTASDLHGPPTGGALLCSAV